MLTVGDKFPEFNLTAVKGGAEGLGGPGVSFTDITNATEVVIAAMGEDDERLISEAADLWFHLLLVLRSRGLDPAAVDDELRRRIRD